MAEKTDSLFKNLTRLFRAGPLVRRKVREPDGRIAGVDRSGHTSSVALLSKVQAHNFNSVLAGGHGYLTQDRLGRLQDYNEMDTHPLINAALDVFAHESAAQDAQGRSLHIYSDNPAIKKCLDELYYDTLNVEFNISPWTRNLVKFGDLALYIDVSPSYGVINVVPIPVNEITREEGFDPKDPFATRFRWSSLGNQTLENWQVAHFRLLGSDQNLPYGTSMVDGARKAWRNLVMIEDAMLVYRVTRAVDRRVFYIDVAGLTPDEIQNYIEQQKTELRSQGVVDRTTGKVDLRYAPLSVMDDYVIPTRGAEASSRIDTLAAGTNVAHVEDVEYVRRSLIASLKIPAAYIGFNDSIPGSSGLAQLDVRFSRTVNMIQRCIVSELNKIAMIHLYAAGFRGEDLIDFELRLSNPSTIAQQQKLELLRTRFEIAGSVPAVGEKPLLSERWILRNVVGLNDKEILQNKREKLDDVRQGEALEAAAALSGGGGGGEGGPGEEPGAPTEEAGAGAAPGGPPEATPPAPSLQTASDDHGEHGAVLLDTEVAPRGVSEGESPVKIAPGLKKALKNRRRNLRRRNRGFPKILDRAADGSTARPALPEFNELKRLIHAEADESERLMEEKEVPSFTSVRPSLTRADVRMLLELSAAKGLDLPDQTDWDPSSRRARVLLEEYGPRVEIVEADDPLEFELYAEEGESSGDGSD